jgi:hypothetical protein
MFKLSIVSVFSVNPLYGLSFEITFGHGISRELQAEIAAIDRLISRARNKPIGDAPRKWCGSMVKPTAVHSMHVYKERPCKDKRGVDLISDG